MGLTLRVAGRPFHSTVLLCCGALGKGLEVPGPGPGLKVAQYWVREGIWLWPPTAGHLGKLNLMVGSEGLGETHGYLALMGPL